MHINDWTIGEAYWKASHHAFYCTVTRPDRTRQEKKLGTTADEAEETRAALITSARAEGSPATEFTVRQICNAFLAHAEANTATLTFKNYRQFVRSFAATVPPSLKVKELRLHHVQTWMTKHYPATGNTNTRYAAVACIKRVFNWATDEMEFFQRNPLAKLKRPPRKPRSGCPTRAQWAEALDHFESDDPFREFVEIMLATGCRPQEVRVMEARHIDWQRGKAHFEDGEVPGKSGARDILLPDEALAILRKNALKHPEGPVMRSRWDRPWTRNSLCDRFRVLNKKLNFHLHAYLARHSVATDMLDAGASAGAAAAILGHKNATMVLTVYGKHIDSREDHLRECLRKGTKKGSPSPTGSGPEPGLRKRG